MRQVLLARFLESRGRSIRGKPCIFGARERCCVTGAPIRSPWRRAADFGNLEERNPRARVSRATGAEINRRRSSDKKRAPPSDGTGSYLSGLDSNWFAHGVDTAPQRVGTLTADRSRGSARFFKYIRSPAKRKKARPRVSIGRHDAGRNRVARKEA